MSLNTPLQLPLGIVKKGNKYSPIYDFDNNISEDINEILNKKISARVCHVDPYIHDQINVRPDSQESQKLLAQLHKKHYFDIGKNYQVAKKRISDTISEKVQSLIAQKTHEKT